MQEHLEDKSDSDSTGNKATHGDGSVHGSLFDGWNSPPNLVTYVRIVLVVVFLALYIASGRFGSESLPLRWSATALFIIAASTDKLDGWMARRYNQVTELGKLLDPIADKLLILAALVVASCFNEIAWWVTALFLIRELGITVMRFIVIDTGGSVIAASKAGKYKTLFECFAIALLLAPIPALVGIETGPAHVYTIVTAAIVYIALILCLYSGGEYLYHTLRRR
ncbi:CDP-diacylglycerol--glycerol-3-phosphate 3-phosphatidyltransferase [Bifidobacterium aquikefiri]|uniref:CDP-diacylglycerol--glycerol-3-phosphate 3-phosphatidyltransferase n=1 Tax=Bifidobacterium aquikefiri TaxID=1653207 RepID=UPI0023F21F7B|nr:CDP-diacylglycerol--glycerol-3-phosphate 3-phosphatidyltransferase [Bifidobacterium aquikefiri]